ncbi:MAG: hypothetical protein ACI8ZB_004745 [Desulforhopalus sp.]|jgi:hypothetical protein
MGDDLGYRLDSFRNKGCAADAGMNLLKTNPGKRGIPQGWAIKRKRGMTAKLSFPFLPTLYPSLLEYAVRSGNKTSTINAWRTGTLHEHLSDRTSFFPSDEDHESEDRIA